jgi:hypothetical protein
MHKCVGIYVLCMFVHQRTSETYEFMDADKQAYMRFTIGFMYLFRMKCD